MPARRPVVRLVLATAVLATLGATTLAAGAGVGPADLDALRSYAQSHGLQPDLSSRAAAEKAITGATPRAKCGPGAKPETGRQGRVPLAEFVSGRAEEGYFCNTRTVGHFGETGGFQVQRYTDATGRTCAYYDSTLLFPIDARNGALGTTVLDMTDPSKPVQTDTLRSPAMQTTHESLRVNHVRGLLVANAGSPATQVGFVDVYDVKADCRKPVLKSSLPIGFFGHEGGFSPDGKTYWVSTTSQPGITAIGLENPMVPSIVWRSTEFTSHGMGLSDNGTRLYAADTGDASGLRILDVTQVQERVANPVVKQISYLTWPEISIPQNVIPIKVKGRSYVVEFDEFDSKPTDYDAANPVGAVRIIDIQDEKKPFVVSKIRLEVHQPEARASDQEQDPNATFGVQGYAAHYCSVPRRVDPGILACSMILSGLRVFDINDVKKPREIAYFNEPRVTDETMSGLDRGAHAMSAPAFDPARKQVWYTDGKTGFWAVELTNGVWKPKGKYPVGTY
ncbi:MAG: hypothetical protein Q8R60_12210 [Mycobacteriales bacterium]|nr:hypothetical protein [Mycobacteriales bacterium]